MYHTIEGMLGILALILAFRPTEYFVLKIFTASLLLTLSAIPFVLEKKYVRYVCGVLGLIIFLSFMAFNGAVKFDSIEAYMKVTKDSEVRYADVEELAKNFGVEGWNPYFVEWEKKCLAGSYDYCRLASYVPRVSRNNRAEELLRMGCNHSDFLSCYNYFFYDEFKKEDRKFAADVILRSCQGPNLSSEYKVICGRVEQLSKAL